VGTGLVHSAPWLMRILAVVGTAAMFLVGGGILVHGLGPLHHGVQVLLEMAGSSRVVQAVLPLLLNALVGVVAGALVLLGVTAVQRVSNVKKSDGK
jgi:predicted DNA repair protein MutK